MPSGSEVSTLVAAGCYLGLGQNQAIDDALSRHRLALFPALGRVHRTAFIRRAANLRRAKGLRWQAFLAPVPHGPRVALVDSFPIPACRLARAHRYRLVRGAAAFRGDEQAPDRRRLPLPRPLLPAGGDRRQQPRPG